VRPQEEGGELDQLAIIEEITGTEYLSVEYIGQLIGLSRQAIVLDIETNSSVGLMEIRESLMMGVVHEHS